MYSWYGWTFTNVLSVNDDGEVALGVGVIGGNEMSGHGRRG